MHDKSTASARPAFVYCRISDKINEKGASLDEQERICREYAASRGFVVVKVFREIYDSEEIERPQLQRMRAAAKRGEAEVVIVWKQDRLGRGNKAHEVVFYMCELVGLDPHCVLEPYASTCEATLTRGVLGIVSGEEKKNIRLRTQGGRRARAMSGRLIPGNRPLYGYQWRDVGTGKGQSKVAYDTDPDTAPVVRRIYASILAGKSLRQIARELTEDGVPTPNGAPEWPNGSVRAIARHPAYTGVAAAYHAPKVERHRENGRRVLRWREREEGERIALPEGTIPAIIDPETARRVLERLSRNKAEAVRNNHKPEEFLLRAGFALCGHCGRAATTSWRKQKYYSMPVYVVKANHYPGRDARMSGSTPTRSMPQPGTSSSASSSTRGSSPTA